VVAEKPSAPVEAPPEPSTEVKPVVDPLPVVTPPVETVPALTGTAVGKEPTEPGGAQVRPQPAQHSTQKVRSEGGGAPSQTVLLGRIQTLERDVEARGAAGNPVSQSGRDFLEKLREEAREANDPASRREVAGKLNDWEKFFLRRR
jgi:hypothetical protein